VKNVEITRIVFYAMERANEWMEDLTIYAKKCKEMDEVIHSEEWPEMPINLEKTSIYKE
jgi:hypothetical protein